MKFAIVRVRGRRKVAPKIKHTLELLLLGRPNNCILVDDTPQNIGMLKIVKDYIAYGPVAEDTIFKLLHKRGKKGRQLLRSLLKDEEIKKAANDIFAGKKTKNYANPVFKLRPPSRGYKNIKLSYPMGDLGKRDDMDSLLKRMM